MKVTFICPGLVVRMPYVSTKPIFVVIECVWSHCVDARNIETGGMTMITIDQIRAHGQLVGTNYKVKV